MAEDKYTAVWVSHTSINDFLACPRAYYLKNVYKDPKTNHKIKIMSPPLALGSIVHEVLESLSVLPTEERFKVSLIEKFHKAWTKVSGLKGGFTSIETEDAYKKRGEEMLLRVMQNPGPLKNLAVKIKMNLPYYWISKEDNIILCGKLDWLEYDADTDSVHIIDFKTSKNEEDDDSLQLPIYCLLATNCQTKPVSSVHYWYLEKSSELTTKSVPNLKEYEEKIYEIAKRMKIARQLNIFKCPEKSGCYACRPFEVILKGEAQYVGVGSYREDVYIIDTDSQKRQESVIL